MKLIYILVLKKKMKGLDCCIIGISILIVIIGILACSVGKFEKYDVETAQSNLATEGEYLATLVYPNFQRVMLSEPGKFELGDTYELGGVQLPLDISNVLINQYKAINPNYVTTRGYIGGGNILPPNDMYDPSYGWQISNN